MTLRALPCFSLRLLTCGAVAAAALCAAFAFNLWAQDVTLPTVEAPAIAEPSAMPTVPAPLDDVAAPPAAAEALPALDALEAEASAAAGSVPTGNDPASAAEALPDEPSEMPVPQAEVSPQADDTSAVPQEGDLAQPSADTQPEDSPRQAAPTDEPLQASLPPVTEIAEPTPQDELSIGSFGISLMYNQEDISNLVKVLELHERKQPEIISSEPTTEVQEADLLAELLRASQEGGEEAPSVDLDEVLPHFYVGTIMFNHPGDWTLWVNGTRFTRDKKSNKKLGVRIESISRSQATLAWKPENMVAAYQRWQEVEANAMSSKIKKKRSSRHREVPDARIEFDEKKAEFIVSLKPNQTFNADAMQVVEGRFRGVVRTAKTEEDEEQEAQQLSEGILPGSNAGSRNTDDPLAAERGMANKLMQNLKQLQSLAPKRGQAPDEPASTEPELPPVGEITQ